MDIKNFISDLTQNIKDAYEAEVTMADAEKLAAKFLYGQLVLGTELRSADLDARMKKVGVKAIRAAIYLSEVQKADKKPSDVMLEALINSNEIVAGEQQVYDESEVARDELQNVLKVCHEAHVYFRGIAKGRFE